MGTVEKVRTSELGRQAPGRPRPAAIICNSERWPASSLSFHNWEQREDQLPAGLLEAEWP